MAAHALGVGSYVAYTKDPGLYGIMRVMAVETQVWWCMDTIGETHAFLRKELVDSKESYSDDFVRAAMPFFAALMVPDDE